MRNQRQIFFALVLGFIIFTIFIKTPSEENKFQSLDSKKIIKIATVKQNKPESVNSQITEKIETSIKEDDLKSYEEYRSCLERAKLQIQNYDFISRNKSSLNEIIGDWFYNQDINLIPKNTKKLSKEEKFMLGLAHSNLLSGLEAPIDYKTSETLLDDVIKNDPYNSAPLIFAALLAKKSNNLNKMNDLIDRVASTKYFNSYESTITKKIYSHVQSESDYIQAFELDSRLPIAKMTEIDIDPISSIMISGQILKKSTDQKNVIDRIDYNLYQHLAAQKMKRDKIPSTASSVMDFLKAKAQLYPYDVDEFELEYLKSCDLQVFEKPVNFIKSRYAKAYSL